LFKHQTVLVDQLTGATGPLASVWVACWGGYKNVPVEVYTTSCFVLMVCCARLRAFSTARKI
jgi:hypothetical protein